MKRCNQVATKKVMHSKGIGLLVDEECGCKAKKTIHYELNGRDIVKDLCLRHFKSVTAWLDRIKVDYNVS